MLSVPSSTVAAATRGAGLLGRFADTLDLSCEESLGRGDRATTERRVRPMAYRRETPASLALSRQDDSGWAQTRVVWTLPAPRKGVSPRTAWGP